MNGIICIDKPEGYTSFDVVAKIRGILKTKKIGHGGTLDPIATGVLPIFVGNATKVCDIMPDHKKEYIADFQLGMVTDTQDCTGKILEQISSSVTLEQLESVLAAFIGTIEQIPPMYSAIKVNGKKLYELARQGKVVERKPRNITIYELQLLSFDESAQSGRLRILCSKGVYVRTICHDIGRFLSCGAVMTALDRTLSGAFKKDDCYQLEQIQQMMEDKTLEKKALIPVEYVFDAFPAIHLNEPQSRMFCNGVKLDLNRITFNHGEMLQRVYNFTGKFLGLATCDLLNGELRIYKLFFHKEA